MSLNWKKIGLTALSSSALFLAACAPGSQTDENDLVNDKDIRLVYVPWDTEIASTNVIGQVLEAVGFDVTLTSLENTFMWSSLATGQADAMVAGWLPVTHQPMIEEYGDQVEYLGTNFTNAQTGLVVPSYMGIDSITELDDQVDKTIVGIEDGAGTNEAARSALEHYPNTQDWEIQATSSGAMATELQRAYNDQEDIVVTGWTPHWKFQQMDLTMLEDPDNAFAESEYIQSFGRQGFSEDYPIASAILEDFYWEREDIESIMLDIQEGENAEDAARAWIEENPEHVQSWVEDARAIANGEEPQDGPHSTAGSPYQPTTFDQNSAE